MTQVIVDRRFRKALRFLCLDAVSVIWVDFCEPLSVSDLKLLQKFLRSNEAVLFQTDMSHVDLPTLTVPDAYRRLSQWLDYVYDWINAPYTWWRRYFMYFERWAHTKSQKPTSELIYFEREKLILELYKSHEYRGRLTRKNWVRTGFLSEWDQRFVDGINRDLDEYAGWDPLIVSEQIIEMCEFQLFIVDIIPLVTHREEADLVAKFSDEGRMAPVGLSPKISQLPVPECVLERGSKR